MVKLASLTALCLLLGACSSDSPSGPLAGTDGGQGDTLAAGAAGNGKKPSGARIRVVNAYNPLNGDPGAIELYANPFSLPGQHPLVLVPFGMASSLFDPTVDDEGNMFISMYGAGTTGNGNAVMTTTQTLKGGEVITYLLSSASDTHVSGRRNGLLRAHHHDTRGAPVPPGKGHVVVDTLGIQNNPTQPVASRLSLQTGVKCLRSPNDSETTKNPLVAGGQMTYELDPGDYTASLHEGDDCIGKALVPSASFRVEAGTRSLLFLHAAGSAGFRTIHVPLTPQTAP